MGKFMRRVESIDAAFDEFIEPLRNFRPAVYAFNTASAVGDFGSIWHVLGVVGAVTGLLEWSQTLVLAVLMGIESLTLNQGVKRLFRRSRPTVAGDDRFTVRRPLTSSFPSGHSSSAFFAAVIVSGWFSAPLIVVTFILAFFIALSRVAVRIHHLSDVVAGAAIGALLGAVALGFTRGIGA